MSCCCRIEPPKFRIVLPLISLAIPITIFVMSIWGSGKISFIAKVLLMTFVLSFVPTFLSFIGRFWGKFLEAVVQAIAATIIVTAFSLWFIGRSVLGRWVLILFFLLVVILVGNSLLILIQEKIINRLSNARKFKLSEWEINRLKESAKHQVLFYASLPIGISVATTYGLIIGLSNKDILGLFIPVILSAASLILIANLVISAVIMSKSLILVDLSAAKPSLKERDESLLNSVAGFFNIKTPLEIGNDEASSENLDMAYLVADLRKVYFYDAVHSAILIFGFILSILSIVNLQLILSNLIWVALGGLLLLFLFCYLPYSTGQYQLHEVILEHSRLEGLKRKTLKKALMKASPLYPQSDFIGALLASGTVGGLLSTLAYELMKNALK